MATDQWLHGWMQQRLGASSSPGSGCGVNLTPLMMVLVHSSPSTRSDAGVIVAQASTIRWASRWDTYLVMVDDQIHWFSIINSLMIVLFLSGMVAMIMMRTLHRDISKYNQLETAEEAQEETGWKLVRLFNLDLTLTRNPES